MRQTMKIAPPKSQESSKSAFTLLELLVVISIIGLLAGMVFTGATSVLRRAEKTAAENTAFNLKTAISTYFTEYRKFPVAPNTTEDQILISDETLMNVLLGSDPEAKPGGLNPRKIAFYTGKQAKRGGQQPGDDSEYRKGVRLQNDGTGILVDPYNNFFRIVLDLDFNNRVEKPAWDTTSDVNVLPETILIWSKGRDDTEAGSGNTKDNIKTW